MKEKPVQSRPQKPKQVTEKGYEFPVPWRESFFVVQDREAQEERACVASSIDAIRRPGRRQRCSISKLPVLSSMPTGRTNSGGEESYTPPASYSQKTFHNGGAVGGLV